MCLDVYESWLGLIWLRHGAKPDLIGGFVPNADIGDCDLLQDHYEAIFFCYSHVLGKTRKPPTHVIRVYYI